jgi:hypothetical protein
LQYSDRLRPYGRADLLLFSFFVIGVLAAAITKLREFQTTSGGLLVLGGRVVTLLAHRALQCHYFAHSLLSLQTYYFA